jgi:S-adenosylmethionine-dependent methyltransferase
MMPDDVRDIQAYYANCVEKENMRLERCQQERDITWRYLDKYLPKRGRILEIGAATGAYTIPLAKKRYLVTAVDFSSKLLEICSKRVVSEGVKNNVTCHVADARDLAVVTHKNFDAVLLMGPLYHLVLKEDREKALYEAYYRLKNGGIIFSTFVSRYGIWGNIMTRLPFLIDWPENARSVLSDGKDKVVPEGGFRGYFATPQEIVPLHEQLGFKTLVLAGIEPAGTVANEGYNSLNEERKKLWLDLLFSISTEPSVIGASDHLLYIGVKE